MKKSPFDEKVKEATIVKDETGTYVENVWGPNCCVCGKCLTKDTVVVFNYTTNDGERASDIAHTTCIERVLEQQSWEDE